MNTNEKAAMSEEGLDLSQFDGYTPGPWVSDRNADFAGVYSDDTTGSIVAQVAPFRFAPRKASEVAGNQKLIAAAPQLLAELRNARTLLAQKDDEIARLRKDAGRYRFLRDVADADLSQPHISMHVCSDWGNWKNTWETGEEADSAIDAALESAKRDEGEGS